MSFTRRRHRAGGGRREARTQARSAGFNTVDVGIVVYPERDTGFAVVKMRAPREAHGRTLAEAALRSRYGVTVVGVKRPGQDFTYAQPDTRVDPGDLLIVAGATDLVEKFAAEAGG